MDDLTVPEMIHALVTEGGYSLVEAREMLVDMGEIDE